MEWFSFLNILRRKITKACKVMHHAGLFPATKRIREGIKWSSKENWMIILQVISYAN